MSENFTTFEGAFPQAGPSSKLQLKNAAHTLATLEMFAKSVTLLRYLSACTIMNKFPLCSVKLPQIDIIYPFCKYFSFRLRMCIFFSNFAPDFNKL